MKTKFTLLLLAGFSIALTSKAQIIKGSVALGGNLSFKTTTAKNDLSKQNYTSIWVSPSFMTFYKNDRGMGFNLNYEHINVDPTTNFNTYGAGLFLRQYKPLGKGFYIFAQEALAYNYTKGLIDSSASTSLLNSTSHQISLTINPGIAYDLGKKFQLELLFFNDLLSASYSNTKWISAYNGSDFIQKFNSFSLGANLAASQLTALNIGAKIFFGR